MYQAQSLVRSPLPTCLHYGKIFSSCTRKAWETVGLKKQKQYMLTTARVDKFLLIESSE